MQAQPPPLSIFHTECYIFYNLQTYIDTLKLPQIHSLNIALKNPVFPLFIHPPPNPANPDLFIVFTVVIFLECHIVGCFNMFNYLLFLSLTKMSAAWRQDHFMTS